MCETRLEPLKRHERTGDTFLPCAHKSTHGSSHPFISAASSVINPGSAVHQAKIIGAIKQFAPLIIQLVLGKSMRAFTKLKSGFIVQLRNLSSVSDTSVT